MEIKVPIGVSNRHVHLTEETYNSLFDEPITKKNNLNQIGEFASNETVTIIANDIEIPNVRILGPFRKYNQIEISHADARRLRLEPPVRRSGDLDDSLEVILKTNKNTIKVKGLIIANRHIHMNLEKANELGVTDKQKVNARIDGVKKGMMEAEIKVTENGYFEMHIDTDDANAFILENNDEVNIIL